LFMTKVDYHHLREYTKPVMVLSIGLLLYVLIMEGKVKGASRWINLGWFRFQPSELAKFSLLIHLSWLLSVRARAVSESLKGMMMPLAWSIGVCGLIALQPNMSTSLVIFFLSFVLVILSGTRLRYVLTLGGVALIVAAVATLGASYRVQRLLAFVNDDSSQMTGAKYQSYQALIAFGSGGVIGVGPGRSQQREGFLPEPYGDFIFSIVGEEYGYVGVLLVLLVFAVILVRGVRIARNAPDDFGFYLASGITLTIVCYAFVNACVNCGLLPTTGLPMPFISYGGTSVVFSAMAVGILLNISKQSAMMQTQRSMSETNA
ncbi:MAG: FtsW/RodA/SpoVE family cell cycle protein, partial [Candidatus Kapaibacterium sp.]